MNGWITHFLVFALGVGTWLPFTIWEGRRVTHQGENHMSTPTPSPHATRGQRGRRFVITVVLVVSALLVGFGLQQNHYQKQNDERATCYEDWGVDVVDTLETRVAANGEVERADTKRDNSIDEVLLLVKDLLKADPPLSPEQTDAELRRVLDRFAVARAELEIAKAEAKTTRILNKYPKINCEKEN